MLIKNQQLNDTLRITLIITLCMLAGNLLHLENNVYLVLYPTLLMTKGKDYSWYGLLKMLIPTLIAATCALIIAETFKDHPFAIWTISLIFIDQVRRSANTPAKQGGMLMPVFNWVLIIVFSQYTSASMPMRIHEIFISMAVTIAVCKFMVWLFPVAKNGKAPQIKPQQVTYQHRFISLSLIGSGLAFLMIVDLLSATFCMVPVIAAATQFNRAQYLRVVKLRFITQIGGCALAIIFTLLLAGHQSVISFYALGLGFLIFTITNWMVNSPNKFKDLHADVLLATVLPIQLYMGNISFGLERTYLRAWELAVTLGILFILYQLTRSRDNNGQINHQYSNIG
ncbi:hypothetical protein AKG98_1586 [Moritella sp. JT01]|uniref:DUF2955 domain-containing protein n=1 Tax=Moritella sp. JT01 TaxID=756698 RepID=UPI00079B3392|nr:DUF2955 domain-containing protein [Moritella sp. JT01]KXO13844.1 hypothetical protein AKG98_1586 [Moritella sp. JT01]